jgi:hypothetical protein
VAAPELAFVLALQRDALEQRRGLGLHRGITNKFPEVAVVAAQVAPREDFLACLADIGAEL